MEGSHDDLVMQAAQSLKDVESIKQENNELKHLLAQEWEISNTPARDSLIGHAKNQSRESEVQV